MERQFLRVVALVIGGLLAFSFAVLVSVPPGGGSAKTDIGPVYRHGFQVGITLAKSGMVHPTAEELDAYARQAASELKEEGGLGFKMQWKSGFEAGWRKAD